VSHDRSRVGFQKKAEKRRKIYKKDPNVNYNEKTLLKIIKQHNDTYSIALIVDL